MAHTINLLNGATIGIYQEKPGKFTAMVSVGPYSNTATADDPMRAIGLAVVLQAGYTESELKKALVG